MASKGDTPTQSQYQPLPEDEVYLEAYANNVYFEHSVWDLKLIFGQLDQREGKLIVKQHTAITLPWAQVKILSYWLRGHVEAYEFANGRIPIPSSVIPPELPPPTDEQKSDPNTEKVFEIFNRLRAEFVRDIGQ